LELGHFDKHGGVVSKGSEKRLVLICKDPPFFVEKLDYPQHVSRPVAKGHAKQTPSAVARMEIYSLIEPFVFVGIFQIDRLANVKTRPGQTRSRGYSDHLSFHSHGHHRPEFIRTGIIEKEAATVSFHHLGSLLCDLKEQSVDLQIEANELTEFKQGLEFSVPIVQELLTTLIVDPAERLPAVPFASLLRKGYFRLDMLLRHGPLPFFE
jgi:hypothetical protein